MPVTRERIGPASTIRGHCSDGCTPVVPWGYKTEQCPVHPWTCVAPYHPWIAVLIERFLPLDRIRAATINRESSEFHPTIFFCP